MPIYGADLQPVQPVSFLWAVPALPAAVAAVLAVAGRALERRFGGAAVRALVVLATGWAVGTLGAAVVGVLAALPPGARLLVDAGARLVDAPPVVVSATLLLDPLRALLALAVAVAGAHAALVRLGRVAEARARREAIALTAATAAALVVVLAGDVLVALVAWEVLAWAVLALADVAPEDAGARVAEAAVVNRVGQVAWLGGVVLLFWALAGGPRVVTADVRGVTGAGIELRTQGDRAPVASLRELSAGPSLAPRDVARQVALRDSSERRPFEEALLSRRAGPLPFVPVAGLCFLLGALGLAAATLLAHARPGRVPRAPLGPFVATAAGVGAVSLLAPFWFLVTLSPFAVGVVIATAVALAAAAAAALRRRRAFVLPGLRRAVRELGVLPAADFARAADWLERRVLARAGGLLALAALVLAAALLVLR